MRVAEDALTKGVGINRQRKIQRHLCLDLDRIAIQNVRPVAPLANGIERVIEIKLNKTEQAMFDKSVSAVRGLIEAVRKL